MNLVNKVMLLLTLSSYVSMIISQTLVKFPVDCYAFLNCGSLYSSFSFSNISCSDLAST